MDRRKKIKLKIQALLSKTTENGASEQEALAAISKAKKLMDNYFITEGDLSDPFLGEEHVLRETPLKKSGYDLSGFYFQLSELFDCKHFYNLERIAFFGFEADADLCVYFYNFIVEACLSAKKKYMRSEQYKLWKEYYHGRTLVASFIRGFMNGVSLRLREIHEEKRKEKHKVDSQSNNSLVVRKRSNVEEAFKNLNINITLVGANNSNYQAHAYLSGIDVGESLEINQGINNEKQTRLLKQ